MQRTVAASGDYGLMAEFDEGVSSAPRSALPAGSAQIDHVLAVSDRRSLGSHRQHDRRLSLIVLGRGADRALTGRAAGVGAQTSPTRSTSPASR